MEEEETKKKKKVLPRVFAGIGIFLLALILIIAAAFAFCGLDKKKVLSVFPQDFSVYLHTDSIWDTADSMLDLKAIDMVFASPALAEARGGFMQFRSASIRQNKLVSKLAARPVDAAIYYNGESYNFLASVDLGALSLASRAFPLYYKKLPLENLSKEDGYFELKNESSSIYIKIAKTLVVASDNLELLKNGFADDHSNYNPEQLNLFTDKTQNHIKVIANVPKLLAESGIIENNVILSDFSKSLPEDSLSLITLNITNEKVNLKVQVPLEVPQDETYLLSTLLNKKSNNPALLTRFRENVQYYTIINIGSLEEIKNSVVPYFLEDLEKLWNTGDLASKTMFNLSLDELLFSWTGSEFAMFGIQNRNNPVFAIQIKDEQQRQKVFDKFISSILINNNTTLLVDGVRIPRLELPSFLQDLLKIFNISLSLPYYFIQDDFIYFSDSAENLSEIYNAKLNMNQISQEKNWKAIAEGISSEASVSLFYNLQRSIPFFLKSNAMVSDILSIYQIGRADLTIGNKEMMLQLSAIASDNNDSTAIPGFPVSLTGTVDGKLLSESTSGGKTAIYWTENKKVINSMEIPSTAIKSYELNDEVYTSVIKTKPENSNGTLWAVTSYGEVYLLNRKMEVQEGFPVLLGEDIKFAPVSDSKGAYIFSEKGSMYHVDYSGSVRKDFLNISGLIKAAPAVCEDSKGNCYIGIYDKSFSGKVLVLINNEEKYIFEIPGIAFGSPAFMLDENAQVSYVSLITQNGDLHIWNLNTQEENIIHVNGIFKMSPVADNTNYYVLSADGTLFRVDLKGNVLEVKIPDSTCNEAFMSVIDNNIYVCPDGNIIYGFDSDLELVYPFPLAGWGNPVFADANGDNQTDCFRLSIDKKLFATQLR